MCKGRLAKLDFNNNKAMSLLKYIKVSPRLQQGHTNNAIQYCFKKYIRKATRHTYSNHTGLYRLDENATDYNHHQSRRPATYQMSSDAATANTKPRSLELIR